MQDLSLPRVTRCLNLISGKRKLYWGWMTRRHEKEKPVKKEKLIRKENVVNENEKNRKKIITRIKKTTTMWIKTEKYGKYSIKRINENSGKRKFA